MSKPTKEDVRRWTDERWKKEPHKPLPTQRELNRQLGHEMADIARKEAEKKRNK